MKDKTDVEAVETDETPKNFIQRIHEAAQTKTGKTVLTVVGTAGAIVATYVLGFRNGQDALVDSLNELEITETDSEEPVESNDPDEATEESSDQE